jgi:hypothetical protein
LAKADPRIFVGTLEDRRSIDAILSAITADTPDRALPGPEPGRKIEEGKPAATPMDAGFLSGEERTTVWLLPLLSTIGKHAEQDMAGEHPASWRSRIEAAGFVCRPVLKGTVEYAGFAAIWLAHLAAALDRLGG